MAKEIDAPYYETSVFTHYGVNELFENVIRVALLARRQQRFWMTNLKHVQRSHLQEPFCPPQPLPPILSVPPSNFEIDLVSLLQSQAYTDVIISVGKAALCCNKVVLAAASRELYRLFTMDLSSNAFGGMISRDYNATMNNSPSLSFWGKSASDSSVASSTDTASIGNFNTDTEQLLGSSPSSMADSGHTNKSYNLFRASPHLNSHAATASSQLQCFSQAVANDNSQSSSVANNGNGCSPFALLKRRSSYQATSYTDISSPAFAKTGVHKNLNHPLFQSISIEHSDNLANLCGRNAPTVQTLVSLTKLVTPGAVQQCLKFFYSGSLDFKNATPLSEVMDLAELLELPELQVAVRNLERAKESGLFYTEACRNGDFVLKMERGLKQVCFDDCLFSGTVLFILI